MGKSAHALQNWQSKGGTRMLRLVKMEETYIPQLFELMEEWTQAGEEIIPWAIHKCDYRDTAKYIASLEVKEDDGKYVPDSTFFCLDTERNIFVGAVNIRHRLSESLLRDGGHIGDGIRPSERGKGMGTQMVGLALAKCDKLGIRNVLMCCNKDNIASAKTIRRNGGILENEIVVDGAVVQRYWIRRA